MTEGRSAATANPVVTSSAGRGRLILVLGVAAVAVLIVVIAVTALGGPRRKVETGIVVAVEATSLSSVQGFSIRTADGRTVDFRITSLENAVDFAAGHLSVHKVSLAPVRVTYVEEGDSRRAVRIEDAP
ncbi:MAG: hypothetical protein QOF49_520 [Chloroflexota bacterium]|nr:hypothetical protein [Chloroflexota bacterium]